LITVKIKEDRKVALNKAELIKQFKDIGIKEGMSLLVHSSLKRVGPVEGGPDTIIDALFETLGKDGTLMMSTVSGNVNPEQPVFHADYTPSTVGYLSNVFRKREGVLRSLHPVHSIVAFGKKAEFFTEGHLEASTPWSPESPYGKIMRNDGFILHLGVDYETNTCIHALEIEARVPGLHTKETSKLYVHDTTGKCHVIDHHWHSPKKSRYVDMEHIVERAGGLTYGQIGEGISRLTDATILRKAVLPVFQNTPSLAIMRLSDNDFIWE
jgi:aminoglycoside 3-N-acetyltransferase